MTSPQGLIYKWTPAAKLEAAYPEFPDNFSVLYLPSLLAMNAGELRHVAAVIDEGRALAGWDARGGVEMQSATKGETE
jgi:hypothetical protein